MHHCQPTRFYSLLAALAFAAAMQATASPLDHWSWCNPRPQGNAVNNLVNANATFIMVGVNGLILTSSDGTNWVHRESGSIDSLSDCAYGNGLFVIVGEYGTVLTSADTINWSVRYTPTFYNLYGVTYGNGRFVAVGEATTILTSENGIDWTRQTDGPWTLYDVVWGSNLFVAVGGVRQAGRPAESTILTSTNGQFWTRRPVVAEGPLTSVAYGDGRFAALMPPSYEIGYTAIWNSTDGLSWRRNDVGPDFQLRSIIHTGGRWLASGGRWYDYFGEGRIYTSPDLTMWSLVSTSASEVVAVAYKDGLFAAAGRDGTTLLSCDATNWGNPYSELRFARFNELKFLNGRFFATGYVFNNHYGIAISDDGCQWAEY